MKTERDIALEHIDLMRKIAPIANQESMAKIIRDNLEKRNKIIQDKPWIFDLALFFSTTVENMATLAYSRIQLQELLVAFSDECMKIQAEYNNQFLEPYSPPENGMMAAAVK